MSGLGGRKAKWKVAICQDNRIFHIGIVVCTALAKPFWAPEAPFNFIPVRWLVKTFPHPPSSFGLVLVFNLMASDDLEIPQIAVVGVQDDFNPSSSTYTLSSFDVSRTPPPPPTHATSPTDNHAFLSPPTPILRSARNSLDPLGTSAPYTSDTSSLQHPPSPTLSALSSGSIRFANSTVLRDNNPEDHDGLSSLNLLAPPPPTHRRKGSIGTVSSIVSSSSTERDIEDSSSFRLSPVRSAHSDATSTLPSSPTYTHVDAGSDAGSRPPSAASFFRKAVHRVRRPSPSPSHETTDTGSETALSDSHRGDNADVKRKGTQLARPVVLDLKQEAGLDARPFAFKPLQLASLVDRKSLEALEGMGGVDALVRGLGTHPTHGLIIEMGSTPSHHGSPDPASQDPRESHPPEKHPPNITITSPAGVPQGLQSTASLGGGSGLSIPTAFQTFEDAYKSSVEHRQRIFGHNILPQRPSKTLFQLMWLALKDKVLVC